MTVGQELKWRLFYDQAWAARAAYLRGLIAGGERNVVRLLRRLDAQTRKYRITMTAEGTSFTPNPWPAGFDIGPAGVPLLRPTSFRGNGSVVPFHTHDDFAAFIVDYIDQAGPFDAVIELGCGYGRNLFDVYYGGGPTHCRYYGGELTESGVLLARELAALEPDMKAEFFSFDYLDPKLDHLPSFDRALVFTAHSIEQVCKIDASLFGVIAGVARRVDCVHFEPFGFQVAALGPASQAHRNQAVENNWNVNFAEALDEARKQFGIELTCLVTESFLPSDPQNPTSLAVWHSERPAEAAAA